MAGRPEGTLSGYLRPPAILLHFGRISLFHAGPPLMALLGCPLNTHYESNGNQESLDQGWWGKKRAAHIYVCPFSGIFDISPVYSNLFSLTTLDVWLNVNHSTQPCVNYA